MCAPAALVLGMLLTAGPLRAMPGGRAGEGLAGWPSASFTTVPTGAAPVRPVAYTLPAVASVSGANSPDTSRRRAASLPDTLRPVLAPDAPPAEATAAEEKPTRKTALFTALAIVLLTISTLLLYNVRSR
jgi:hypothetical protein